MQNEVRGVMNEMTVSASRTTRPEDRLRGRRSLGLMQNEVRQAIWREMNVSCQYHHKTTRRHTKREGLMEITHSRGVQDSGTNSLPPRVSPTLDSHSDTTNFLSRSLPPKKVLKCQGRNAVFAFVNIAKYLNGYAQS